VGFRNVRYVPFVTCNESYRRVGYLLLPMEKNYYDDPALIARSIGMRFYSLFSNL